jgi:hypothetical protein
MTEIMEVAPNTAVPKPSNGTMPERMEKAAMHIDDRIQDLADI